MRDTIRSASKRISEIEREAAEQFDSSILHNRVREGINQSDLVRYYVDLTERAYQLEEEDRYPDRIHRTIFGAAEELNDEIEDIVESQVAAECAAVIKDVHDGWFDDQSDEEDIQLAFDEACEWLAEHGDAACDADVDIQRLVYGEDYEKSVEVTPDA